jgi:hypothetical protein
MSSRENLNDQVRGYWEQKPCGTSPDIVGELEQCSPDWFERVEATK